MAERPTEKTLRDVILDLKSKLLKSNLQNERLQLELYDVKRELENTRAEFLRRASDLTRGLVAPQETCEDTGSCTSVSSLDKVQQLSDLSTVTASGLTTNTFSPITTVMSLEALAPDESP